MAPVYVFRCPNCHAPFELAEPKTKARCGECDVKIVRDWKAGATNIDLSNCRAVPRGNRRG
jgi:DNA-directed RNA polymerase subunit RPC12/RpoP